MSSPSDNSLRAVAPLVELPALEPLPQGGGRWTEQFTARCLLRGTLAHPAFMRVLYEHDQLRGQAVAALAEKLGITLRDANIEAYDRFADSLVRAEAWLVDRRRSTRGYYGNLLVGQDGMPRYGHVSDEITIENYVESGGDGGIMEVWKLHDTWVRREMMRFKLALKLRRPGG